MRKHRLDALFLIQVYFGSKFCPFWKFLVFEFLLGISETLLCSMSASQVKIDSLLDVHQLLMLFLESLMYSEPRTVSFIIFYNMSCLLLLVLLLHIRMYECYPFSPPYAITIANVVILLLSLVNNNFDFHGIIIIVIIK
jgi:hypothetical protein